MRTWNFKGYWYIEGKTCTNSRAGVKWKISGISRSVHQENLMWNFKVCHTILQNFQGPRSESLFSLEFARVKSQIYTMSRCFFSKNYYSLQVNPLLFFFWNRTILYILHTYNLMVQVFFPYIIAFLNCTHTVKLLFGFSFLKQDWR